MKKTKMSRKSTRSSSATSTKSTIITATPKKETRQLRKNPPQIYKNLKTFDDYTTDKEYEQDYDFVDTDKKKTFYDKYNSLDKDYNCKLYLVRLFHYVEEKYLYKVGHTNEYMITRLESLNKQYHSGYDIELIHYFKINHRHDEKRFHDENKHLLYSFVDEMGRKDREIYDNEDIVEMFMDFESEF